MAYKFLLLFVAAVGAASLHDYQQQSQLQQQIERQQQQQRYAADANDQRNDDTVGYDFSYSVQDPITGDYKSQEESRRNGNVRGQYSWVDADGNRQIVDYRADDRNGFSSEHRREPAARPRLNRVLQVIPAQASPLYTIDTVIAPVYSSASRVDHSRNRSQDPREDRDNHNDERDNREDRDDREGNRDDRDNRDDRENRDDRDNRDGRDNRDDREGRDNRDGRDGRDGRDSRDNRENRDGGREGRDRSRDGRRGREGHAQSEVRFQDPSVAYQYRN